MGEVVVERDGAGERRREPFCSGTDGEGRKSEGEC